MIPINVKSCDRCGQDHQALAFAPLERSDSRFTHSARCPVTGMVLLAALQRDPDATGASPAVVRPSDPRTLAPTLAPGVTAIRDAGPVLERRSFEVKEIRVERSEGKPPRIVGYAATFNSPSKPLKTDKGKTFVETIAPGAFTRALTDGRDIAALVGHQPNHIVARTSAGKMALKQDEKGLAFDLTPPDTTRARDLLTDIEHGNIRGMSFGFGDDGTQDAWAKGADGTPNRTLKDIDLREISFTPFPAYNDTSVGVRSVAAGLEELEKREHPHDYSTVVEHARDAGGMCRSVAQNMMRVRDVLDGITGKPTDKELKHVRDLHDSLREMSKRCNEVRSRTRALLTPPAPAAPPATEPGAGSTAGPNDGNDVARMAARLNRYTRSTGLSPTQLRDLFAAEAQRDASDAEEGELSVQELDDGWYVMDDDGNKVEGPFESQSEAQAAAEGE